MIRITGVCCEHSMRIGEPYVEKNIYINKQSLNRDYICLHCEKAHSQHFIEGEETWSEKEYLSTLTKYMHLFEGGSHIE